LPDSDSSGKPVGLTGLNPVTLLNGTNSTWQVQHLPAGTEAIICDELGRVILRTDNYQNDFSFQELPSACYFYKLQLSNGEMKGGKIIYVR